jgi:hypothetical protein
MAAIAVVAAFSGIIHDPVQALTGIHRRRLSRFLDAIEESITRPNGKGYGPKDTFFGRAYDLVDWIKGVLSFWSRRQMRQVEGGQVEGGLSAGAPATSAVIDSRYVFPFFEPAIATTISQLEQVGFWGFSSESTETLINSAFPAGQGERRALTAVHGQARIVCPGPASAAGQRSDYKGETFAQWARSALDPEAHLVTDGLARFNAAAAQVATHGAIIAGERNSRELGPFRWVNIFISNVKTSITGTCHHFNFGKYRHRYLAEAQYRVNRRVDPASLLGRLVHTCARTAPCPEHWLRLAAVEISCGIELITTREARMAISASLHFQGALGL